MSFNILDNRYLIDSQKVVEAIRSIDIKPMPWVPNYIIGSTTLRGQILPVIDLNIFFEGDNYRNEDHDNINSYIAVNHQNLNVIIKVGKIIGTIEEDDETKESDLSTSDSEFFDKVLLYRGRIYIKISINNILNKVKNDLRESFKEFNTENRNILEKPKVNNIKEKNIQLSFDSFTNLAPIKTFQKKTTKKIKYTLKKDTGIIFVSSGLDFLVRSQDVVEVIEREYFDEVANSDDFIVGVLNYRGKIISIIRFDKVIGSKNSKTEIQANRPIESKVIILNINGNNFGLVVDKTKSITHFKKEEVHSVIRSQGRKAEDYLIEGVLIKSGDIIFILNLNFIYNNLVTKKNLAFLNEKSILFENRLETVKLTDTGPKEEYLLFTLSDRIFSVKTSSLVQITDQRYIVHKNYSVKELLGAVALKEIMPLFDLGSIIENTPCNISSGRSEVIILKNDDLSIGFLVEKVLDKVALTKYLDLREIFSKEDNLIKAGINGLFDFKDDIVIDLDVDVLLKTAYDLIKSGLKMDLKSDEFESTLSEDEKVLLNTIKEEYSELEKLLSQKFTSSRHDLLVFKRYGHFFAVDIDVVGSVFIDFKIRKLPKAPKFTLGQVSIEEESSVIFDIVAYVLNKDDNLFNDVEFIFSLKFDDKIIFIPSENIYGVYPFHEEEFNNKTDEMLQSNVLSNNFIRIDEISDTIHIFDRSKLIEFLETKKFNVMKK